MSIENQDKAVKRAICAHEHWKAQWSKRDMFSSVEMISPRGKTFTVTGYQLELSRHLDATVKKIRKALGVEGGAA